MEGFVTTRTTGRWVADPDAIPVIDAASVSLVRERVREVGARVGLPEVATAALVNVASELANNQLAHARLGVVAVRDARRGEVPGLEVVAADVGPGIVDVAGALQGRAPGGGSLGVGLSAVFELADEVDVDVRLDEGTCVWARKLARLDVRRRRVASYGRPCAGERTSGDTSVFVRTADALVVAVVDGLGHGEPARDASERARDVLLAHPELSPEALLERCHGELARTRGAVMTVARVDEARGEVAVASVGNVGALVVGPAGTHRFGGSSFVVGSPRRAARVAVERRSIGPRDVLILYSDGVSSRVDLSSDQALLREPPIVVAQRVVERFARDHDDAMVLVVG